MKTTLSTYEIVDILRQDFSYEAAKALAEYYEELEQSTGEEMEMDRVAIRCDWTEYESAEEFFADYPEAKEDDEDEEPLEMATRYLEKKGVEFILVEDGILVAAH